MGGAIGCLCGPQDLGVDSRYVLQRRVGAGATGSVWLGIERLTGIQYALKFQEAGRNLRPVDASRIIREIQLSVELGEGHVNIIRPHELILTNKHLVLATEFSQGGTLESYAKRKLINEDLALYLFLQIVSAVQHCHHRNIVYRDVKLVNVLLDGSEPPVVQLCDFGVAKRAGEGTGGDIHRLTTFTGTAGFLAPEVIAVGLGHMGATTGGAHAYDGTKSDVWALGVLLFVMLVHELPFFVDELDLQLDPAHALKNALKKEQSAKWVEALGPTQRQVFQGCSPEVQDLLGRMFDKDESTRASIDEILKHPWCQRELPAILQNKLNHLAAEQAAIDSESDRPRYCVADGDKRVAQFVEQVFSDEYREKWAVKRGHHIVDRMMLTWSGLVHEKEGLPKEGEVSEAVAFAAQWAAQQAEEQMSVGGGLAAAGAAAGGKESGKRRTDTSSVHGYAVGGGGKGDASRHTATGTHKTTSTAPPSATSSLHSGSGGWSPGGGNTPPGMSQAAAAAPYKSRARISQIISQQKVAQEDGSVVSAWTPHKGRGPGGGGGSVGFGSVAGASRAGGSLIGPRSSAAAAAAAPERKSSPGKSASGPDSGPRLAPRAESLGVSSTFGGARLDALHEAATPGQSLRDGVEAEEVLLAAAPAGRGKKGEQSGGAAGSADSPPPVAGAEEEGGGDGATTAPRPPAAAAAAAAADGEKEVGKTPASIIAP